MAETKDKMLADLREALNSWESLLATLTEQEIKAPRRVGEWSISDVLAHLMAWQQVSTARLQAAALNDVPVYPGWLGGTDPIFAEEHVNEFNARIQAMYRDERWPSVHRAWRKGFDTFLEIAQSIPEADILADGRYGWLKGYPLAAVLQGSLEHHQEHLQTVMARLEPSRQ